MLLWKITKKEGNGAQITDHFIKNLVCVSGWYHCVWEQYSGDKVIGWWAWWEGPWGLRQGLQTERASQANAGCRWNAKRLKLLKWWHNFPLNHRPGQNTMHTKWGRIYRLTSNHLSNWLNLLDSRKNGFWASNFMFIAFELWFLLAM